MTIPKAWDKRDYDLRSALQNLPSYGIIAPDDHSVSLKEVEKVLIAEAEKRGESR